MRRRLTIKLLLALVSFVPDVVSFVVDHVPASDPPAAADSASTADRCC